ncbi:MAG: SDR family NAD(P)-dependent oxidoreductase, partial [Parvularculaceae bacterium]
MINKAGISQRSIAKETSPEVYRTLLDIDLMAPIWLTQLQLPKMAAAGGGHIVAISSVAGRIGVPLRTAYCAAKHGLIGYMDALRTEVESLHN